MLISPLMGPIMGVGLSIGLNDFELMKRSLKSYLVATLLQCDDRHNLFFFYSLDEVQSELLARTSPTIRCVHSLSGWSIGIVALATPVRKRKCNTWCSHCCNLLMPRCVRPVSALPRESVVFLGAFYLYFINPFSSAWLPTSGAGDALPAQTVCG